MVETYLRTLAKSRRDIPWMYRKKGKLILPQACDEFSPLMFGVSALCTSDEFDMVASFLTENCNRSVVTTIFNSRSPKDFPCAQYKSLAVDLNPVAVISIGRSTPFRFITTDGIQSDRASFVTFAAPFRSEVWLALGCATIGEAH